MAWNRPSEDAAGHRVNVDATSPSRYWWYITGAIVVLGAAVAWWCLSFFGGRGAPCPAEAAKPKLIKELKPAIAKSGTLTGNVKKVEAHVSVAKKTKASLAEAVKSALPTDEKSILERVEADAKRRGVRRIFTHETDTFLSQYAIPGESSPPPPWDEKSKEKFIESILDPIQLDEKDSARERELKEGVAALREDLKQWLKQGGDFYEYVDNLQKRQEREANIVEETKKYLNETFKETGNIEEAIEFWRATNAKLEKDGLRKIKVPPALRIALIRQRMEVPKE